jgi:hypothetical protein
MHAKEPTKSIEMGENLKSDEEVEGEEEGTSAAEEKMSSDKENVNKCENDEKVAVVVVGAKDEISKNEGISVKKENCEEASLKNHETFQRDDEKEECRLATGNRGSLIL